MTEAVDINRLLVEIELTDMKIITDGIETSVENSCGKSSFIGSEPPPPPPPPIEEDEDATNMVHMNAHIPLYEWDEGPK